MYIASNNGLSIRWVDPNDSYVPVAGEISFDEFPTDEQIATSFASYRDAVAALAKREQILNLESQITPRRLREAVLGVDGGWLLSINNQINALRA
jgi:hypothetical protein